MADALRPLTLLLGAACLWALFVLLLALAGLGSHFPAVASEVKPPAIPVVSLTRGQSRLGPMTSYLEVGERPLLTADRRPAPMLAADGQAGTAELDVVLTSVLITPRLQMAILTDNKDSSELSRADGRNSSGQQLAPGSTGATQGGYRRALGPANARASGVRRQGRRGAKSGSGECAHQ